LPPLYWDGGFALVCDLLLLLPDDFATGFGAAGLGVAMPAPCPPGIVSVWPRTRLGSSSSLASMISCGSTWYFAASASSVSLELTVMTTPLTGGIVSVWPMWRSSFARRWLAHHTVIIETPNLRAMPVSVSPARTL
jgi:hypothetical protein